MDFICTQQHTVCVKNVTQQIFKQEHVPWQFFSIQKVIGFTFKPIARIFSVYVFANHYLSILIVPTYVWEYTNLIYLQFAETYNVTECNTFFVSRLSHSCQQKFYFMLFWIKKKVELVNSKRGNQTAHKKSKLIKGKLKIKRDPRKIYCWPHSIYKRSESKCSSEYLLLNSSHRLT